MDHGNIRLDFVGIGAAKAATTWLAACLAEHPQICLPEQKELNYFCTTYSWWSKTVTYHDEGIEWLQRQFSGCRPGQLLGEFSPNYLVDPTSPTLIRAHNPEIKIIISYRNPVEGLYSHYYELHKRRPVPDTFEEFVTAYPNQLQYGLFYTHTLRFLGCFPLRNFHFIVYEDIVEDPEGVLRTLFEFLGVSTSQMPSKASARVNVRKTPRTKWVRDFVSNSTDLLNSNAKTKRIKRLLRGLGAHLVADRILAANMRPGESPPMAEKTRSKLIDLYAGARLGNWASCWTAIWIIGIDEGRFCVGLNFHLPAADGGKRCLTEHNPSPIANDFHDSTAAFARIARGFLRRWRKPGVGLIARLIFTVAALTWVFLRVDLHTVVALLVNSRWQLFVLAVVMAFLRRVVLALQTQFTLNALSLSFSLPALVRLSLISTFYGLVLPGDMAGVAVNWYRLARPSGKVIEIGALLVYLRLINTLVLVAIGLIAMWFYPPLNSPWSRAMVAGILICLCLVVSPFFFRQAADAVEGVVLSLAGSSRLPTVLRRGVVTAWDAVRVFHGFSSFRSVITLLGLSLLATTLSALGFLFTVRMIGASLSLLASAWLTAVLTVIQMLPLSLGGLGVREVSLVVLLQQQGGTYNQALAISLANWLQLIVMSVTGAGCELWEIARSGRRLKE